MFSLMDLINIKIQFAWQIEFILRSSHSSAVGISLSWSLGHIWYLMCQEYFLILPSKKLFLIIFYWEPIYKKFNWIIERLLTLPLVKNFNLK